MKTKTVQKVNTKTSSRSPTLETILMVEKAAYKYRSDKTTTEIWKLLPRKVMWTTYTKIIRYLEYSGKIIVDRDKRIAWIWDPEGIEKAKRLGLIVK